jgi:hypothetical protein
MNHHLAHLLAHQRTDELQQIAARQRLVGAATHLDTRTAPRLTGRHDHRSRERSQVSLITRKSA